MPPPLKTMFSRFLKTRKFTYIGQPYPAAQPVSQKLPVLFSTRLSSFKNMNVPPERKTVSRFPPSSQEIGNGRHPKHEHFLELREQKP